MTDLPTADFHDERIDMAYWLPKLREINVPIPESQPLNIEPREDKPPEWDTELACEIVENLGGEAFVRSGYKSAQMHLEEGSHIYDHSPEQVDSTIKELLSQHMMMQMPVGESLWLREHLDLNFCEYAMDNLNPEIRVFIRDGEVTCWHPRLEGFGNHADHREHAEQYCEGAWPKADDEGWRNFIGVETYAERVAAAFDGWWSVDFVMDRNNDWYCTDMALDALYERGGELSGISAHPGDCEHDIEVMHND